MRGYMLGSLEFYIGLKYTRAKRRNHFISFISAISMGGIALAVMLLITVLSVMNGFESELRNRILSMVSHVEIVSAREPMTQLQQLEDNIRRRSQGVIGAAPYISGQAMVRSKYGMSGVMVRGVIPKQSEQVSDVAQNMEQGAFDALKAGKYRIVIGSGLARMLG